MEYIGLNDLREKFLSFFESKGHTRLESFPLVPINDESLLLINSGMAPMKNYFLGKSTPPAKRVTSCQKCIRTPDIENVGKTSRHGTFFEMLGNFSFGDYFKKEACTWAWEFIRDELKIPLERLYVSVYQDDDEAFDFWKNEIKVPEQRIVKLGKEDNFWEIGSGPCGPCSEIYYDRGEQYGCDNPNCAPGCDCDRFVEFWNLVFSQFNSDGEGNYAPMEHPNIDTGMGLERIACIMQGVDNLFEVDTIKNILDYIASIAKIKYKEDEKQDVSLRVITDHIRSTVFMISDGVFPSNEGRGYVLRRLLRRAERHGRLIGIKKPFLADVCDVVINENKNAYPELLQKADYIKKVIKNEEDSFAKTIDNGMEILQKFIEKSDGSVLPGEAAFMLSDTFGFPLDLTVEIVGEKGIKVDIQKYNELLQKQRDMARNARQNANLQGWKEDIVDKINVDVCEFVGYENTSCDAKITAMVSNGEICESAVDEQDVIVMLDKTPFYAESGGQVADIGYITFDNGVIEINNCKKSASGNFLHIGHVTSGTVSVGDIGKATINIKNRMAIKRNHTCAHLLHAALREVLGTHVAQSGSLVNAQKLRFDFSHFSAMTAEEIKKVEKIVNKNILKAIDVKNYETDIDKAKEKGAMALFSEKYGKRVRVCEIENASIELCGGTHVTNTAQIGLFKIISESSVASGIRRIEAVTGENYLNLVNENDVKVALIAEMTKASSLDDAVVKVRNLTEELKEKINEINALQNEINVSKLSNLFENAVKIDEFNVISAVLNKTDGKSLRDMVTMLKDKDENCVAILIGLVDSKGTIAVGCGKNAVKNGLVAGKLAGKVASFTGGKGGGKPDVAMAGVGDIFKVDEALAQIENIIKENL